MDFKIPLSLFPKLLTYFNSVSVLMPYTSILLLSNTKRTKSQWITNDKCIMQCQHLPVNPSSQTQWYTSLSDIKQSPPFWQGMEEQGLVPHSQISSPPTRSMFWGENARLYSSGDTVLPAANELMHPARPTSRPSLFFALKTKKKMNWTYYHRLITIDFILLSKLVNIIPNIGLLYHLLKIAYQKLKILK